MRALGLVVALIACSVCGSALAAKVHKTDFKAGVRFDLDGHLLTATLVPPKYATTPDPHRELMGHRVTAVCGTRIAEGKGRTTHRTRHWPSGRPSLKFWFAKDISAHVRWCVLETGPDGGDLAVVYFPRRR